jgi:hypothetical protein
MMLQGLTSPGILSATCLHPKQSMAWIIPPGPGRLPEWHFFINMSKKMPVRQAANVLQLIGAASMIFNFLIATPLHDIMVILSSTLSLMGLFYITVFIYKTRLHLLKFCCILCLLTFYYTLYLYGSGDWGLLAIMQKVSLISAMLLILGLEYFTRPEDFKQSKPNAQRIQATKR